jgi:hypothetical protein
MSMLHTPCYILTIKIKIAEKWSDWKLFFDLYLDFHTCRIEMCKKQMYGVRLNAKPVQFFCTSIVIIPRCTYIRLWYSETAWLGFPAKNDCWFPRPVWSKISNLSKYLFTGKKLTNKFVLTGKRIPYVLGHTNLIVWIAGLPTNWSSKTEKTFLPKLSPTSTNITRWNK